MIDLGTYTTFGYEDGPIAGTTDYGNRTLYFVNKDECPYCGGPKGEKSKSCLRCANTIRRFRKNRIKRSTHAFRAWAEGLERPACPHCGETMREWMNNWRVVDGQWQKTELTPVWVCLSCRAWMYAECTRSES